MNGVHDMGGMHGFGAVVPEADEAVFHEEWEGRVFGITRDIGIGRMFRPGGFRYAIERLDPAFYLNASYHHRHLEAVIGGLIESGLITEKELQSYLDLFLEDPSLPVPRRNDPERVERLRQGASARRERPPTLGVAEEPAFAVDDLVRARNIHPEGHTRLPRYVRGKKGMIAHYYGVQGFPDHVVGEALGSLPQPLYNVRFSMRELWGTFAESEEYLFIDLWESYLEVLA
jgi:nitrile hydratase